jgi:hypothetical protein
MDMNNENLFELREKKESSLAADQESVTEDQNLNNSINDSSNEDGGSSVKNKPQEIGKDDVSEDSLASETSDKEKETVKEEPPAPPQVTEPEPPTTDNGPETVATQAEAIEKESETVATPTADTEKVPEVEEKEPATPSKKIQDAEKEPPATAKKLETAAINEVATEIESETVATQAEAIEIEEPPATEKKLETVATNEEATEIESETVATQAETIEIEEPPATAKKLETVATNEEATEIESETVATQAETIEIEPPATAKNLDTVATHTEATEKESESTEKKPEEDTAQPQISEKEPEVAKKEPATLTKNAQETEKETQITDAVSSDDTNKEVIEATDKADLNKKAILDDSKDSEGESEKKLIEPSKTSETEDKDAAKNEVAEKEIYQEEIEEDKDYSILKKDELINEFETLLKIDDLKLAEKKIKELKPFYQGIVESERKEALKKFLEDGGAEIDFKYIGDALDSRYANLNDKYKGRRNAYYSELEKNKESNLGRKQEILEKLRAIVDGEETNASISALKNITKEWRSIGPVPSAYAKSMWATYNILVDRFYDNRSIYFELKELDRKKNLESKLELCEKAEHLLDYEVIRDAVKELNELHEEFKHIGPVPKEMQEVVWQRFKSASDAIYNRRKDYVSGLKKELHENLESKNQLVDEVAKFNDFDSEKISDWNEKTKEILDLQKKWEKIGGLPREHAKEVNRHFWSSFKSFFNNKNKFFKKLESQRDDNLLKKEDLVKRAETLQESSDWEKTAEQLKELQREWKDIGPVPEKNRNEVYKKFKKACDSFFNKRREHSKEVESEYKVNLKKKEEICADIEKMVTEKDKNIDRFKELQVMFNGIGFVPRNTIKRIQKKFSHATELFLSSFDLSETEKSELRFAAEVDKLKASPNADRRIYRKEIEVKRLISKIENDIALWKNNIEFFAKSKTADKVREEFNDKIAKATSQLEELREELKVLNKI